MKNQVSVVLVAVLFAVVLGGLSFSKGYES